MNNVRVSGGEYGLFHEKLNHESCLSNISEDRISEKGNDACRDVVYPDQNQSFPRCYDKFPYSLPQGHGVVKAMLPYGLDVVSSVLSQGHSGRTNNA